MPNYVIIEPSEILASAKSIDWVERKLNTVEYSSGNTKHMIDYGSVEAAQAAVDKYFADASDTLANGKPKSYKFDVAQTVLQALVNNINRQTVVPTEQFYNDIVNRAWDIANKMNIQANNE